MNQIPWNLALAVFLGTSPMLGAVLWNLMEIKTFRSEVRAELLSIRADISAIRSELTKLTERVAILEERERLTHPVLTK